MTLLLAFACNVLRTLYTRARVRVTLTSYQFIVYSLLDLNFGF